MIADFIHQPHSTSLVHLLSGQFKVNEGSSWSTVDSMFELEVNRRHEDLVQFLQIPFALYLRFSTGIRYIPYIDHISDIEMDNAMNVDRMEVCR